MPSQVWVPRESVELVALDVKVDGAATTNYQVAVTQGDARPSVWVAPAVAGPDHGYMTGSLTPGLWRLWVKVTDSPEIPVGVYADLVVT